MTYEEAIAELDELSFSVEMTSSTVKAVELAIEALQKQVLMKPSVVKVVRCKDCKFYHSGKTWHCEKVSYFENGINGMFYCAYGEKK